MAQIEWQLAGSVPAPHIASAPARVLVVWPRCMFELDAQWKKYDDDATGKFHGQIDGRSFEWDVDVVAAWRWL